MLKAKFSSSHAVTQLTENIKASAWIKEHKDSCLQPRSENMVYFCRKGSFYIAQHCARRHNVYRAFF